MRNRARAFRRPTAAPCPPVVVVLFFGCFVFGGSPHGGPGSLGIFLHGGSISSFRSFGMGGAASPSLHTLESQMQAFLGKAGASRSEHGCPAISAGTSGKLTWKVYFLLLFFSFFFFEGRIRSPRGLEDIRNPSFAQAPRENASLPPALSSPSSLSRLNTP